MESQQPDLISDDLKQETSDVLTDALTTYALCLEALIDIEQLTVTVNDAERLRMEVRTKAADTIREVTKVGAESRTDQGSSKQAK